MTITSEVISVKKPDDEGGIVTFIAEATITIKARYVGKYLWGWKDFSEAQVTEEMHRSAREIAIQRMQSMAGLR